jgi:hypothetical protein
MDGEVVSAGSLYNAQRMDNSETKYLYRIEPLRIKK